MKLIRRYERKSTSRTPRHAAVRQWVSLRSGLIRVKLAESWRRKVTCGSARSSQAPAEQKAGLREGDDIVLDQGGCEAGTSQVAYWILIAGLRLGVFAELSPTASVPPLATAGEKLLGDDMDTWLCPSSKGETAATRSGGTPSS